jgi:hypothetical protein
MIHSTQKKKILGNTPQSALSTLLWIFISSTVLRMSWIKTSLVNSSGVACCSTPRAEPKLPNEPDVNGERGVVVLEMLENAVRGRSANAVAIKVFGTSTPTLIVRWPSSSFGVFLPNEIIAWRARAFVCQDVMTEGPVMIRVGDD